MNNNINFKDNSEDFNPFLVKGKETEILICPKCNLKIGWFEDSFKIKWFGCECKAKLTEKEYFGECGE